jgi:hypothetical protein
LPLTPTAAVTGRFQYRNLPDVWDIAYFGAAGEIYFDEHWSYSGSLLFGKDSDDRIWAHLPAAGFVLLFPIIGYQAAEEDISPSVLWLLLLENIHYNIRTSEKVTLSPYITLLGFDGVGRTETEPDGGMLSSGVGFTVRVFPVRHLTIAASQSVKRFFIFGENIFATGSQDRFGYTLGIDVGYVF